MTDLDDEAELEAALREAWRLPEKVTRRGKGSAPASKQSTIAIARRGGMVQRMSRKPVTLAPIGKGTE